MRRIVLVAAALVIPLQSALAQSVNNRKTVTRAIIAGSHKLYDGDFSGAGTSSVCGELPKERNFAGVASFIIEYPSDVPPAAGVQSISFASAKLVGKATTATVFRLSVSVAGPAIGRPYAYVLNTDDGKPNNSGVATLLRNKGGSLTLKVKGHNDMSQTIDLTVTCS
jgi:hypothetical protein